METVSNGLAFFALLQVTKILMSHLCSPDYLIIYSKWKTQEVLEVTLPTSNILTPQLYFWEKDEGLTPTAEHSF